MKEIEAVCLKVSPGRAPYYLPNISISCSWLSDMGFVTKAPVQILPDKVGFSIRLCDENMARGKNSRIMHVSRYIESGVPRPRISICGRYLFDYGLAVGDSIIAQCTYGHIRIRKAADTVSLVGNAIQKYTREMIPLVRLSDEWLSEYGFVPDAPITAATAPGRITITLHENDIEQYDTLVKFARANRHRLFQVRRYKDKNGNPYIEINNSLLDRAGLNIGDVFDISSKHGSIELHKLNFSDFGF